VVLPLPYDRYAQTRALLVHPLFLPFCPCSIENQLRAKWQGLEVGVFQSRASYGTTKTLLYVWPNPWAIGATLIFTISSYLRGKPNVHKVAKLSVWSFSLGSFQWYYHDLMICMPKPMPYWCTLYFYHFALAQ